MIADVGHIDFLLCRDELVETRSTADAVERPSPIHLLRSGITVISENTKFQFEVVDDPLNIPT